MRVDESACNQQQETVVRLITENKGLRELLEISQRSLSTPVQRVKRPSPTIHKEVAVFFLKGSAKGYARKSRHPRALELVILSNFRCKQRLLLMKLRWSPFQDLELQEMP